jgi:tetratricopeptide (TPR) repeat protein
MSQSTSTLSGPRRRFGWIHRPLLALFVVLLVAGAFLAGNAIRSGSESLTGSGVSSGTLPAATTADQIASLQARLTANGDDLDAATTLATLYLQQARETGDPNWYGKAETLLNGILEREPEHVEALAGHGALALARHDFAAALDWANQARAIEADALAVYPVLIDAYVELGRYDEAIAAADEFINLRPNLASYTRVAYLRELHGDPEGAAEALLLALDTVPGRTEPGGWTRVQLGNLYLNAGNLDAAEREYQRTLALLPDYAPATAGLGRVAAARGDYPLAIELLGDAAERVPLPEYVIALGDVYAVTGNQQAASEQYALVQVMTQLLTANGVNTDLELALFAADHPEYANGLTTDEVVSQARAALATRPSIYSHDTLAWALYRSGDADAAWDEIQQALRLGTRDALLHYHAGMIALARGDADAARTQLETALAINPQFSILHAAEARATLATIGQ